MADHTVSIFYLATVKHVLACHAKRRPKIDFRDQLLLNSGQKYCRMLSWKYFIAECSLGASICNSFDLH